MEKKGKLFVISAPSGAGKTTLIREVLKRFDNLAYSVSHTTRSPRKGEVNGQDYFFTDTDQFKAMIEAGLMLEWAKVHGNYYGTSKAFVEEQLKAGNNLLLDIDVQGGRQIMESNLDPVSIFIMPPDLEVLEQRLVKRATDTDDVIRERLNNAKQEIAQRQFYGHVIVNDVLEKAVEELSEIFARKISNPSVTGIEQEAVNGRR